MWTGFAKGDENRRGVHDDAMRAPETRTAPCQLTPSGSCATRQAIDAEGLVATDRHAPHGARAKVGVDVVAVRVVRRLSLIHI